MKLAIPDDEDGNSPREWPYLLQMVLHLGIWHYANLSGLFQGGPQENVAHKPQYSIRKALSAQPKE